MKLVARLQDDKHYSCMKAAVFSAHVVHKEVQALTPYMSTTQARRTTTTRNTAIMASAQHVAS